MMILKVMLKNMSDTQLRLLNTILSKELEDLKEISIKEDSDEFQSEFEYSEVCKLYQYLCGIKELK